MKNIGRTDKIIRIILGLILLGLLFILEGNLKYIGLIGVIPIFTASISFYPLYRIFGIKTSK